MENGYENFVDTLRQSLLKETSYEEEMICYKKAEEYRKRQIKQCIEK